MVCPRAAPTFPAFCQAVIKAVESGAIEVVGAKRQKLAFPINDLLAHEAVAAIETFEDVDMLRDLLTDAKAKKVKDAINRRLKILRKRTAMTVSEAIARSGWTWAIPAANCFARQ
jgi:hypothetical protein